MLSARRFSYIMALILIVMAAAAFTGSARADNGAAVYPQSPSSYTGFGGSYAGSGIVAMPNGGFIDVNHNSAVSGDCVTQAQLLSGGDTLRGVVTPGCQAIVFVIVHP
jgi:hypothetical protein